MTGLEGTYPVRPVSVSTRVDSPADMVFEFVSDTRNDPDWCPNVTRVQQIEGEGVAVGSRFRFHQTVEAGRRALTSDVEVEVLELGDHEITWRVEDRFQTRVITLRVTPHGDGARLTQTTTASFKRKPGMSGWLYPFLARRVIKDQFRHLASHLALQG